MKRRTEFTIVTSADSLTRSGAGKITGRISIRLGRDSFPDESWNDFAVVVLRWWCQAFLSILTGATASAQFSFMDGPFEVSVSRTAGSDLLRLEPKDRGGEGSVPASIDVREGDLLAELTSAGRTVIGKCRKEGWTGRDVEELSSMVEALSRH